MTPEFLDYLPLGSFIIEKDYTVRKWNRIIEEWSRILCGEIEGRLLGEIFKKFGEPRYLQAIDNCLVKNSASVLFSPALHKDLLPTYKPDGSKRTQIISISPIIVDNGEIQGFFTVQDITDLTQANLKLREAQLKIEREVEQRIAAEKLLSASKKQEALSKLATGFAHIVNNKLQAISSAAEIAVVKADNPEKVQIQIDRILTISRKTGELSSMLWDFSQNHSEPSKEIPILNILNQIAEDFEARNRSGIQVEIASLKNSKATTVNFSQSALFRILTEVLNNALEALENKKAPLIRIEFHEDPKPGAFQANGMEFAVVIVSDNGEGMSEDTVAHAFDPFFSRRENRNGIGLTIAREKAIQFGGDLRLLSAPGKGTEVQIFLPKH